MARPRTDIAPRILEAARTRFLAEGVEGASLRKIASDAGTSIGMIYYYYPTKDDLFFAVVSEVYDRLVAELEEIAKVPATAREVLLGAAKRLAHLSPHELEVIRLIIGEALISSPRFKRLIEKFQSGHVALLVRTIIGGQESGELRRDTSPLLLGLLAIAALGPAQFIAAKLRSSPLAPLVPSESETAARLLDLLFEGIGEKAR
jgi:AcrR family transcriptional regulator